MKVLVIPDIHGRKFWREVLANNIGQVDKVIFLGDYLDPYMKEIEEDTDSMECNDFYDSYNLLKMLHNIKFLKENEPNKYILLTGNHTDSYIWSKFHAASRTDYRNWEKYHNFFSENLNLFNLVWVEDDCIFSHAGISEGWAKQVWKNLVIDKEFESVKYIADCLQLLPLDGVNKVLIDLIGHISHYRWGEAQFGSCEWADIREHINHIETLKLKQNDKITKIVPIGEEGIYQVFGHTQLKEPLITDKWACLDCRKGFIFDTLTHECKSCL